MEGDAGTNGLPAVAKQLPADPHEVEAALLGAVLIDPGVVDLIAPLVSSRHFIRPQHAAIWNRMLDQRQRLGQVDIVTLVHEFRRDGQLADLGGLDYFTELANATPSARHAAAYAMLVRESGNRTQVHHAATELLRALLEGANADAAVQAFMQTIEDISGEQDRMLSDTIDTDPAEDRTDIVPSGLHWFDDALPGRGMTAGATIGISGEPGQGKSALALQVILAALEHDTDLRGVWVGCEMTERQIRNRALICLSGLSLDVLRLPWHMLSARQEAEKRAGLERIRMVGPRLRLLGIVPPATVEAKTRIDAARLVVVDYLQLVPPNERGKSRRDDVDQNVRDLLRVAKSCGAAMLLLSNMGKSDGRRRDVYTAWKESSEIAHALDHGFTGEWDDLEPGQTEPPDRVHREVRWRCVKAREGEKRDLRLRFDMPRQHFSEAVRTNVHGIPI